MRICRGVRLGGLSVTVGTRDGRASFRRMERAGPLQVYLTNHTDQTLRGGTALISFEGAGATVPHKLPDLAPRQSHAIEVPLDTSLRPGRYALAVAASAEASDRKLTAEHAQAIAIVARPLPCQMPVVMWGSGGAVDVLSQWTYCYPDPLKIGQATDELFAVAEGRSGQQVMKMTQVIWYRRQTAPELPKDERRTYGTYVGHHGKVMEKGLPSAAALTVRRPEAHVYDLVAHKPVPVERRAGAAALRADFGPGDGRLFLLAPRPIAELRLEAPDEARLGGRLAVSIAVLDDGGAPLAAVAPIHLEVLDPEGRPAEFSGHYGARDGRLAVALDLAPNDLPGDWTLRVAELASGLTRQHRLTVRR